MSGSCTHACNPTAWRGTPSMETYREEGQRHKTLDSVEAIATPATAAVTAAVEVVEPQSPGEPHHHHHHHEGTESCSLGSFSHQKQLEDRWEVETHILRSADHLGYLPLESISTDDVGVRKMKTGATRAGHVADDKVGQTKRDLMKLVLEDKHVK
ncbi:hypothetical protein Scep_024794 [Stephania cephalantha]|uniref:Uncharacterized protein n=1 Tax=Stephania cephalantha TaxID=152367 RepID=A0AAP0F676_9MAGN